MLFFLDTKQENSLPKHHSCNYLFIISAQIHKAHKQFFHSVLIFSRTYYLLFLICSIICWLWDKLYFLSKLLVWCHESLKSQGTAENNEGFWVKYFWYSLSIFQWNTFKRINLLSCLKKNLCCVSSDGVVKLWRDLDDILVGKELAMQAWGPGFRFSVPTYILACSYPQDSRARYIALSANWQHRPFKSGNRETLPQGIK